MIYIILVPLIILIEIINIMFHIFIISTFQIAQKNSNKYFKTIYKIVKSFLNVIWAFLFLLNNLLMHDRNVNYIYKEFELFMMIVYDCVRIIFSEMRAEILFSFTSRAM